MSLKITKYDDFSHSYDILQNVVLPRNPQDITSKADIIDKTENKLVMDKRTECMLQEYHTSLLEILDKLKLYCNTFQPRVSMGSVGLMRNLLNTDGLCDLSRLQVISNSKRTFSGNEYTWKFEQTLLFYRRAYFNCVHVYMHTILGK